MRWLADECVHRIVVEELRKAGHDVVYIAEIAQRSDDRSLFDMAAAGGRIVEPRAMRSHNFTARRHL